MPFFSIILALEHVTLEEGSLSFFLLILEPFPSFQNAIGSVERREPVLLFVDSGDRFLAPDRSLFTCWREAFHLMHHLN